MNEAAAKAAAKTAKEEADEAAKEAATEAYDGTYKRVYDDTYKDAYDDAHSALLPAHMERDYTIGTTPLSDPTAAPATVNAPDRPPRGASACRSRYRDQTGRMSRRGRSDSRNRP